jgi:ADP-heptose:LPS heptosyltransferase
LKSIKKKKNTGIFEKFHLHRLLLILTKINFYPAHCDVITRYLTAAGMANNTFIVDRSPKLFFKPSSQYERLIQSDTIIRPSIALFPFSAWKNKEWPVKYYMAVGKFFISKGWNVIIMGSRSEKEDADQLRLLIGLRSISLAGQLSLYECGCVLSRCSVALGNDSGLSHLSRACGVKTGIIYGPTTHHFGFFPSGDPPFKIFETPMRCRPCHAHGGNMCWRFDHDCMKKINPEMVIKGLLNVLELKDV